MKKLIALILTLTLVFALASCGSTGSNAGSNAGSDAGSSTQQPSQTPETPAEPEIKSADLQAFYDATFAVPSDSMPALMPLDNDMLNAFYPGLTELELKQCIVAMPMISAVPFELALVEVANAEDMAKVEEIIKGRIETQTTPPNYPPVIEAWEKFCKTSVNGNSIMMITMEGGETYLEAFNALFA